LRRDTEQWARFSRRPRATTFLAAEARHTEFFRLSLDDVCRHCGDLQRYQIVQPLA